VTTIVFIAWLTLFVLFTFRSAHRLNAFTKALILELAEERWVGPEELQRKVGVSISHTAFRMICGQLERQGELVSRTWPIDMPNGRMRHSRKYRRRIIIMNGGQDEESERRR